MKYIFFLLIFGQQLFSQQYNVAYYKTVITEEKITDTISNVNHEKQVADFFSKILIQNLIKDYKLIFENDHSNFKEMSSLSQNENNFFISDNIIFDYVYTNISKLEYLEQKEFLGKSFIVTDTISSNWTITNESKEISGFKCHKAYFINKDDVMVSAWFTYQIPLPFGPDKYCGLPGLIMEVNIGNLNLICYKLDFEKKVKINIPTKGSKVSQSEFDMEVKKKFAEIRKIKID